MYYLLNDDMTIESVLSGSFTGVPDGHGVYLAYPLSGLLSAFYKIIPIIPWFALLLIGCYLFTGIAVGMVSYRMCLGREKKQWGLFAFSLSVTLFILMPQFIGIHYTVCAATLAAGAIFLMLLGEKPWIGAIAMAVTYCVRRDVFLLALPFFGVAWLWRFRKNIWKKMMLSAGALVVLSLAFAFYNAYMYQSREWKEYRAYNDFRTELYDYSWYKQYEEIPDDYERFDVSRQQYDLIDNYAIALDDSVDGQLMLSVQTASTFDDWVDTPGHTLKRMLVQYRNWILGEGDEPYTYIVLCMYAVLCIVLIKEKRYGKLFLTFCLGLGRSAIWVFLFWRGRFPERVMMSLFVIEFMLLLAMLMDVFGQREQEKKTTASAFYVAAGAFLIGMCVLSSGSIALQKAQGEAQKEYAVLEEYLAAHPENTYFCDIRGIGSYTKGLFSTERKQKNALLPGGWLAGSPLMKQRMEQLGAVDGGEALVNNESVYYITTTSERSRDYVWLQRYLWERFRMQDKALLVVEEIAYNEQDSFLILHMEPVQIEEDIE